MSSGTTSETDPRGWVAAAPELANLLSDPRVAAAVQRGDAEKLREALLARRQGPRGPFEGKTIDRLLERRRLFTSPVKKAPRLYTLNGFGTRIYGKSDVAADGSYIGTLFATALYFPVLPLAQYLVHQSGNQYLFFGQVPLSRPLRVWRAAVALVAVLAALSGGGAVWRSANRGKVWFANGLDAPVKVIAGAIAIQLQPGGLVSREMPTGQHRIRTESAEGRVIEEIEVEVPRWTDLVAYNVLGAAPIYAEQVVYQQKPSGKEAPATVQLLGGSSFVARDHVSYVFTTPPRQIETKEKGSVIRWQVAQAPGGWDNCAAWLTDEKRGPQAVALAAAVVGAEPGNEEALDRAVRIARAAGGPEGGLAVARKAAAASPDSIAPHRYLQHFLAVTGRREEARRIYRERFQREPGSTLAAYLRARVEDPATSLRLHAELVERSPAYPAARRGLAWRLLASGRFAEALAQYEEISRISPQERDSTIPHEAWALVALGRAREAAVRVAALAAGSPKPGLRTALLYARLARIPGTSPPHAADRYLEALGKEPWMLASRSAWSTAFFGTPPPKADQLAAVEYPPLRQALGVLAAAGRPGEAVARAKDAAPAALALVDDALLVLLAGEALRVGEGAAADRMLTAVGRIDAPATAVRDWIAGRGSPDLFDVDPELEPALALARARAEEAAGRPSAELYRLAAARERIPGIVTRALSAWPRPRG